MGIIQKKGYTYSFDPAACEKCTGYCCRGKSGFIWVNRDDIQNIANQLQMNQIDVIDQFLIRVNNRLSIQERNVQGQYECVFYDTDARQCSVYAARPIQCREFPFWKNFRDRVDELTKECPGVVLPG